MRLIELKYWILTLAFCSMSAGTALAGVSVTSPTTLEQFVKPGAAVEGQITLRNMDAEPCQVRVFATDYQFYADGRTLFGEPAGQAPRSNAAWITFTPHQVTVPGHDTASIYYNIQVPSDSTLIGTYWSVLMVEPLAPASLEPPNGKPGVAVRTAMRYAVQMITEIGDTGLRGARFVNRQLLDAGGKRTFRMDVENTGERLLRPTVWAQVFDQKGVSLGKFEGGRIRVYPGCSTRVQIDLSTLPKGQFNALIVADNGDESVFGSQMKLDIP